MRGMTRKMMPMMRVHKDGVDDDCVQMVERGGEDGADDDVNDGGERRRWRWIGFEEARAA